MIVKFENITKNDEKTYQDFLRFHTEKYFMRYVIKTLGIIAILIYMIVSVISFKIWKLVSVLVIGLISYIIYRIYSQKKIVKDELKSSKIVEKETFIFKFYDKIINIDTGNQVQEIRYKNICKAFEVKKYFYLYIDKTHAFILDKNGFVNQNNNEFKKFLKNKLKRRFKYKENL